MCQYVTGVLFLTHGVYDVARTHNAARDTNTHRQREPVALVTSSVRHVWARPPLLTQWPDFDYRI